MTAHLPINAEFERRLLQIAAGLACLVPLSMGAMSIVKSATILPGVALPIAVDLDSHFRYLSGLLLGIGILFAAAIPRIESRTTMIRTIGAIVVIGGLARLASLVEVGAPGGGHRFGLAMELVVVPLIVLWQTRIARRFDPKCVEGPPSVALDDPSNMVSGRKLQRERP